MSRRSGSAPPSAPPVPVGVALRIDAGDIRVSFHVQQSRRAATSFSVQTTLDPESWVNVGPEMVGDGTEMEMTHQSGAPRLPVNKSSSVSKCSTEELGSFFKSLIA